MKNLPSDRWDPSYVPLTNGSDNRSAAHLLAVVAQFSADSPRYAPTMATWCNIMAWDLSRALGCEIPHWIRGYETRANDLAQWLEHKLHNGGAMQGPELGWREVKEPEARDRANGGFPTFVTWQNPLPTKPGHIALVIPSSDGVTRIAQAGAKVFLSGTLRDGFGGATPLRFWTHD